MPSTRSSHPIPACSSGRRREDDIGRHPGARANRRPTISRRVPISHAVVRICRACRHGAMNTVSCGKRRARRGLISGAGQTEKDLFMAPSEQTIRAYHQRSKHARHRFAPGPGYLDWDTQPEPFRCYEGARRVDLPLDLEPPTRPFDDLDTGPPAPFDIRGLGRFLELALGLSAWKEYGGCEGGGGSPPRKSCAISPPTIR